MAGREGRSTLPTRTNTTGAVSPHAYPPSFGQQMPQMPQHPGYNTPVNHYAYGTYAHKPYGHPRAMNFGPTGGSMLPPNQQPMGWGEPNPFPPNIRPNKAMEVDELLTSNFRPMAPMPRQGSSLPHQNPRRDHTKTNTP
jgi:hypothetical protein